MAVLYYVVQIRKLTEIRDTFYLSNRWIRTVEEIQCEEAESSKCSITSTSQHPMWENNSKHVISKAMQNDSAIIDSIMSLKI